MAEIKKKTFKKNDCKFSDQDLIDTIKQKKKYATHSNDC